MNASLKPNFNQISGLGEISGLGVGGLSREPPGQFEQAFSAAGRPPADDPQAKRLGKRRNFSRSLPSLVPNLAATPVGATVGTATPARRQRERSRRKQDAYEKPVFL